MSEEVRTPLIRLEKRSGMDKKKVWAIRVASILVALILGCIPMIISGNNPFSAYGVIIQGFKMRFWNIGAEGQITIGAMCATYFALYWYDKVPHVVLLLIMFLAAVIGGGIWALIPAFFKAKWNTNETLFTLMMNYIAIGIVAWLQHLYEQDKTGL